MNITDSEYFEALVTAALNESNEDHKRARDLAHQWQARIDVPAYLRPKPDDTADELRRLATEAAERAEAFFFAQLAWCSSEVGHA